MRVHGRSVGGHFCAMPGEKPLGDTERWLLPTRLASS